jgi:hypothetical protein
MKEHSRCRTIGILLAAIVVLPAVCWVLLGMPPLQAMLIGAVAVVVAALVLFPPDGYDAAFPAPPTPVRDRGARREAFRLSWNVAGREDRVGSTLIGRLQQIASRRLVEYGLALDEPGDRERLIELLDQPTYRVLTLQPGGEASTRAFEHALGMVERISPSDDPAQMARHPGEPVSPPQP